jgi:phospholipid/cholesterol/gamma-HCH transport system permease protein
MTIAGIVLPLLALLTTTFLGWLIAPPLLHFSRGIFFEQLSHNIFAVDLFASMLKHAIMAAFVAVVACQKGLSCERGAEGVGRAVNQTVVLSFLGIWFINTFFNLAYLSFYPDASTLRG